MTNLRPPESPYTAEASDYPTMLWSVKQQWLDALRSGRYEQTTRTLVRFTDEGQKYCCLGVLCDVVGLEPKPSPLDPTKGEYLGESGVLPALVFRGVGLDLGDIYIPTGPQPARPYKTRCTLAELNDDGFTFAQIADVIEYFVIGEH